MNILRTNNDLQECFYSTIPPGSTLTTLHNALSRAACIAYGTEGSMWRMIKDRTVIGFHVRALAFNDFEGETLHIA